MITQWQTVVAAGDAAGASLEFVVLRPAAGEYTVVGTDTRALTSPLPADGSRPLHVAHPAGWQTRTLRSCHGGRAVISAQRVTAARPSQPHHCQHGHIVIQRFRSGLDDEAVQRTDGPRRRRRATRQQAPFQRPEPEPLAARGLSFGEPVAVEDELLARERVTCPSVRRRSNANRPRGWVCPPINSLATP